MSKQFQLRRGTTADNESFTGAEGELTLDTEKKQLHIHDGETAGGTAMDYVVEWQMPNIDNNFTWFRKYVSGWVEQGGQTPGEPQATSITITLPVTMTDGNYYVGFMSNSTGPNGYVFRVPNRTTTTFTINVDTFASKNPTSTKVWMVCGMAA